MNKDMEKNITHGEEDEEAMYFNKKVRSFGSMVLFRFRHHKLAMVGASILLLLILMAILAPVIARYPYDEIHMPDVIENDGMPIPPCSKYWFGTDNFGRDYFTRCVYGARISLSVGIVAEAIAVCIGVPLGCLAGYAGKTADIIIMRLCEIMCCIPTFFLILTVNATLDSSIYNVMIILGLFGWEGITRQVRAQFLSLRNQDFIQAATAMGLRPVVVVFRHILPNAITPVIINVTMGIGSAIMTESGLSYLGLGVQEPIPSWGAMVSKAQAYIDTSPWLCIFPGMLIAITTLSLNFMGDGLRDAFDPRSFSSR